MNNYQIEIIDSKSACFDTFFEWRHKGVIESIHVIHLNMISKAIFLTVYYQRYMKDNKAKKWDQNNILYSRLSYNLAINEINPKREIGTFSSKPNCEVTSHIIEFIGTLHLHLF